MKLSERFNLPVGQFGIDFVDVNPERDTKLYLNPHFLSTRTDRWSKSADATIKSFFQTAIDHIGAGDMNAAEKMFGYLSEPSETCLGMATESVQGSGIGSQYASDILTSLQASKAVQTGLVKDLEDSVIFVDGVGKDRLSDITANVIRGQLLEYTKTQCSNWKIPMNGSSQYVFWDTNTRSWQHRTDKALVIDHQPVLLVPKWCVSKYKKFNHGRYFNLSVLDYIQNEVSSTSDKVSKRTIKEDFPSYASKVIGDSYNNTKDFLRKFTSKHNSVFRDYKKRVDDETGPLELEELASDVGETRRLHEIVEYLKTTLVSFNTGKRDAEDYHRLVAAILDLIFYPDLINQKIEYPPNTGRKRVDITFENAAESGVFDRIINVGKLPASYIFIECKNYSSDPKNPEVDQLSGRLTRRDGMLGILTVRQVSDRNKLVNRCRDIYNQKDEVLIFLEDSDLEDMLDNILDPGVASPYESKISNLIQEIKI